MKCLAVLFITAIAATTLVSSNAVLSEEERQTCYRTSLANAAQAYDGCRYGYTLSSACVNHGSDICSCCRNILGGSRFASGYSCCMALRNYINVAAPCVSQYGRSIPDIVKNCNLRSSAATTTISYFTGLLLLLTAVAYQLLFWGLQREFHQVQQTYVGLYKFRKFSSMACVFMCVCVCANLHKFIFHKRRYKARMFIKPMCVCVCVCVCSIHTEDQSTTHELLLLMNLY